MAEQQEHDQERSRHHVSGEEPQEVFQEEAEPQQQTQAKGTQRQGNERRPSTRRKRNYSSQIKWTYELNKDLHRCHLEADKSVYGYSGRLKKLWDKYQPEYAHLNSKHLTTQATRIVQKGLVSETKVEEKKARKSNEPEEHGEDRQEENNDEGLHQNDRVSDNEENGQNTRQASTKQFNEKEVQEMMEAIRPIWMKNYEHYLNVEIKDREFTTRKDRKIEDIEIEAVNRIIEEILSQNGSSINLWHINVMQYATAITLLSGHGKLRENKKKNKVGKTRGWMMNIMNRINAIRRKLSYINLVRKCREQNIFTQKQKQIERNLKRRYGNINNQRLYEIESILKHDLSVQSKILRDRKIVTELQRINSLFYSSPKNVYREFRKNGTIDIKDTPPEEEVKGFWNNIWGQEGLFNRDSKWLEELQENYCKDVKANISNIKYEHFEKVNENLKNATSPGLDLTVGYWVKQCKSTRRATFDIFRKVSDNKDTIPEWLVKTRTTLLAKNQDTKNPKNFRPIACENMLLKTYTGTLALLIEEHLADNNIIAPEQAGAKKGMWGCTDQLLINRAVTDEAIKNQRNLYMIWLDYKKAYDSVPHGWITEAMKLAKIPAKIIEAINQLISKWQTELSIPTVNGKVRIGEILYRKGVLQGDYLNVILFILSLNPLSFLLDRTDGFKLSKDTVHEKNITHLLFVDDLKLLAPTLNKIKLQLDIVTTFSKDIGMTFGEDKCAYICIDRGKRKSLGKSIEINGVTMKELQEDEPYRYLGQDETVGYDGKLNKERIQTEYYRRARKIWSSELNARNKAIAHNSFALPVLVPTIGVLDWSIAEIENIDKQTRKILCMRGSFHRNSDKDRGRGLKSFEASFKTRIVALKRHIVEDKVRNHYLENVEHHETDKIIRLGNEYERIHLTEAIARTEKPEGKEVSQEMKNNMNKDNKEVWLKKPQHGYLHNRTMNNENVDVNMTNAWLKEGKLSSHIEGYLCAVQEQEIETRKLRKQREKNRDMQMKMPSVCRLCGREEETIFHITSACSYFSSNLYLHSRHNLIAKEIHHQVVAQLREGEENLGKPRGMPPTTLKVGGTEIWWDREVNTLTKIPHNRPDLIIWDTDNSTCKVIDVCVPLDTNVELRETTKRNSYIDLVDQLQRIYPKYKYTIVPIIVGALGTIPKKLKENLQKTGIKTEKILTVTKEIQKLALLGTLKVCKNFQKIV